MEALPPARVGWCPGVLNPMRTGDGLLLRVKPRCGVLPVDTMIGLARLAADYGNGMLDLTARANLQIRGVTDATRAALTAELDRLGLVDPDPAVEAVRNIVASPLAGLDPGANCDVRPIVAALEAMLLANPDLLALPAKWSFGIDDGGWIGLRDTPSDIGFHALPDGCFAVSLAGDPLRGRCAPETLVVVAVRLCRFALAQGGARRMDELVFEHGAAAILAAAQIDTLPDSATSSTDQPGTLIGVHTIGRHGVLGLAPPFGRLSASALTELAEAARWQNASEFRLTTARGLLVVLADPRAGETLAASIDRDAWITTADDPRLTIAACSGKPACPRGSTPVLDDAARAAAALATRLAGRAGTVVHVSGCAKGCAHPRSAPATLVGRDGLYDLVLGGKAGDKPSHVGLRLQPALRMIETAWR